MMERLQMAQYGIQMFPTKLSIISQPPAQSASYSLSFDGTDDYIDLRDDPSGEATFPAALPIGNAARTISAWIRPADITSTGFRQIFGYGNIATHHAFFFIHKDDTIMMSSYSQYVATSSSCLSLNTWHHVVVTYDGGNPGTVKLYENADEVGDGTVNDPYVLNTYVGNVTPNIGRNGNNDGEVFNGNIDEVGVWDVALDADAITTIYGSGTPIDLTSDDGNYDNSDNLIGYWKFNEGSGTSAGETTGTTNIFDGTISGAAYDTEVPPN